MNRVYFVSEPVYKHTNKTQIDKKEPFGANKSQGEKRRRLSTIEEIPEQEQSDLEVKRDACVVDIGADAIETIETSTEERIDLAPVVLSFDNPDNVVVPCSLWQEWRNHFTIDQFLFSLFLGLIPTAWDMFSDLNFGADLESMDEVSAAGLTKPQLYDIFDIVKSSLVLYQVAAIFSSLCLDSFSSVILEQKRLGRVAR